MSHLPMVEIEISTWRGRSGWTLIIRHRHFAGRMSDCPGETYTELAAPEMTDVIAATMVEWSDLDQIPYDDLRGSV